MNNSVSRVKLQKVGNSHAVIIPSKFLKDVGDTKEVKMEIEANEIRLTFVSTKSLKLLIEEKRARNKSLIAKMMKEVDKMNLEDPNDDYILPSADDLID